MTDTDYYRSEITDTIKAGPTDGSGDAYQIKVSGNRDTKWMRIRQGALRVLADAMDTDSPPSLLPLANGHRVIRADVDFTDGGVGRGVVICPVSFTGEEVYEYAVWRVWLHKNECRWLAETGAYHRTLDAAIIDYNERRA